MEAENASQIKSNEDDFILTVADYGNDRVVCVRILLEAKSRYPMDFLCYKDREELEAKGFEEPISVPVEPPCQSCTMRTLRQEDKLFPRAIYACWKGWLIKEEAPKV